MRSPACDLHFSFPLGSADLPPAAGSVAPSGFPSGPSTPRLPSRRGAPRATWVFVSSLDEHT
ncbi:MAG: hypothetical protein ACK5F7_14995, partial [Planctomycetaceae bacterium]